VDEESGGKEAQDAKNANAGEDTFFWGELPPPPGAAVTAASDGLGFTGLSLGQEGTFPGPHAQRAANQPSSSPIARLDRTAEIQNQFLQWIPNFTFNHIRGKTQGLPNASSQNLSMPRVFVSKNPQQKRGRVSPWSPVLIFPARSYCVVSDAKPGFDGGVPNRPPFAGSSPLSQTRGRLHGDPRRSSPADLLQNRITPNFRKLQNLDFSRYRVFP
jgi:hypothetical protein